MQFPSVSSILEVHQELLRRTGGSPGWLNLGAVDSALYRAAWGPFRGDPDLADRAALLLRGLCQDHPFVDGNKRTSFEAARLFLRLNGTGIDIDVDGATEFLLQVAQGFLTVDQISDWIRRHSRKDEIRGR